MSPSRRFLALAIGTALMPVPVAAAPRTYTVVVDKMKFGPLPSGLHKGDTVIWVNRDFLRHSATAANRSFDADLLPNTRVSTLLKKGGTIPFACRYHPGMRGVLRVQ